MTDLPEPRRRLSSLFETGTGARVYPYLLVLPAVVLVVGVVVYPVLSGIWYAFHDVTLRTLNRGTVTFVGLRNFERAFADPVFWQAAWNTVVWVTLNVVAQLGLGLALALLLNRPRPGIGLFRSGILIPWVCPAWSRC